MRVLHPLSSLCQTTTRPYTLPRSTRKASSLFYTTDPARNAYDVSELVLALDAYDSKYVRLAEDVQQNEAPSEAVSKKPGRRRVKFRERRGQPSLLRPVLMRKSQEESDDTWSLLLQLRSAQVAPSLRSSSRQQEPSRNEEDTINKELLACRDPGTLRELIRQLFAMDAENFSITRYDRQIINAIQRCHRAHELKRASGQTSNYPFTARDALQTINSISMSLSTKGLETGSHGSQLFTAGLYYAAKAENLSAVAHYIDLMLRNNSPLGYHTQDALRILLHHVAPRTLRSLNSDSAGKLRVGDILQILTGWTLAGNPEPGEERGLCFASLAKRSIPIYRRYIRSLGMLGATEALSYEWSHPISEDTDAKEFQQRRFLFVDAFLLAKEPRMAIQLLRSTQPVLAESKHSSEKIPVINSSLYADTPEKLQETLLHQYILQGLPKFDAVRLWARGKEQSSSIFLDMRDSVKVEDIKTVLSASPENSLSTLEELLEVKWVPQGADEGFHVPKDRIDITGTTRAFFKTRRIRSGSGKNLARE